MAQTLKVLLWKMVILRKRRWFITFLEIALPIFMFWLLVYFKNILPDEKTTVINGYPQSYESINLENSILKLAYTPSTNVTDTLMNQVFNRFNSTEYCQVTMEIKSSEEDVVKWLKEEYINETSSSDPVYQTQVAAGVGVIFLNDSTSSLSYRLRTTVGDMETDQDSRYSNPNQVLMGDPYSSSGFLPVQAMIDQAFLSKFHNVNVSQNVYVEKLPYMEFSVVDLFSLLLPFYVTVSFTFLMPSLIGTIVEEKSSGFREMMKVMGLKTVVNWFNWVFYSLSVFVPVSLVVTWLLTLYDGKSTPAFQAGYFPVWVLFMLFGLAFIAFICAETTFFTNGTIALIAAEVVWNVVSIVLFSVFTQTPAKYPHWVHMTTCLWPSVALQWGLNTIAVFQKNGKEWTVTDLFDDGMEGQNVSVGHACVMLIVDIVFYAIITWYMDNIKPGPFGRAKPFYFPFQWCKRSSYDPNVDAASIHRKNYESPPTNAKVGISIKGLRKTFNSGNVVAVENVDLDIYKGNITALLGHNGAGKTTTMSMLTGFFSPTSGKIVVNGQNIFENMDKFRSSLGLCTQHNLLFSFFTVHEHLVFFGMLKGISKSKATEDGLSILRALKIEDKKNELVKSLSGGMKRKLCLAISLIGNPEVLVLDEPTSGLDPESRRQVWDILLEYRGQRTMIISTHFMEEADVLGDRIAIMDHGKVSCYGTSMFLKKLYGTGYQLNITKREGERVTQITSVVEQNVMSASLKLHTPTQLSYSISADESRRFPALFAALERWSQQLGIKSMALTCTTMEDVFLKVAEEPQESERNDLPVRKSFSAKYKQVMGFGLFLQQIHALIYQRILSKWRSPFTLFIYTVLPILLSGYFFKRTMDIDFTANQPDMKVSLANLYNAHVAVSSDNFRVTSILQKMISAGHATYDNVTGVDLTVYFDNMIENSLVLYEQEMVAGFLYTNSSLVGGYNVYSKHASSVMYNMLANTLLQLASPKASITTYNHPISAKSELDICDLAKLARSQVFLFPMVATFISLGFLILTMSFIPFPLKERVTNSKQLQLMTGVSPFLYWLMNFVSDYLLFIVTSFLMVCTLFIFQTDNIYSLSGYLGTLLFVVAFYGVSGIMFAYFFSFLVASSIKASVFFVILNMIFGTVAAVLLAILEGFFTYLYVYRYILSVNPLFTVTYAVIGLVSTMYIDGTCNQCEHSNKTCQAEDPFNYLEPGMNTDHPHGINNHLIFLAVDALLYFSLVMMIEYGLMKRLWFLISQLWIRWINDYVEEDRDVTAEKQRVNASKVLRGHMSTASILFVDDLGKKYNARSTAVQSVTFQVGQGECFGLLGVNGAGKTTTFKMLTGEEIPNKGDAKVVHYSLQRNKSQFLSRIGYCPQFDAINGQLTGREMLYIYALLRGIPRSKCNDEVSRWLQIMGLSEYSDRQCGTYSGGNKRKLSTAMAFIGSPRVVFLDEPTSGVDPVSRRKLWNVMSQCQQAGQSVVLTSHSMEECEALCSRLTIMVAGRMKCIGSAQYLKHKFGQGFTIKFKLRSSLQDANAVMNIKSDMARHFRTCTIKDQHLGLLHYHIPDPNLRLSQLFGKLEHMREVHRIIEDYIVSDTSLEEVFMSFARSS